MKKLTVLLLTMASVGLLTTGCINGAASKEASESMDSTIIADANDPEVSKKEIEAAFKRMWDNVTLTNAEAYFKTDVSDSFYTINADGIVQNKKEYLADKKRQEMLEILDFKFFDQLINVYGNVGIINGRIQAFSNDNYVGEVLYTAIFIKENDVWLYKNWQGTWSIDSPPPPSFIAKD